MDSESDSIKNDKNRHSQMNALYLTQFRRRDVSIMDKSKSWLAELDYSQLMDLRIDYAFKLLFTKGDSRLLISLLNAIFANKKNPPCDKIPNCKKPISG